MRSKLREVLRGRQGRKQLTVHNVRVWHSPAAYPSWPLHDRLASVALLESTWVNFRDGGRTAMAQSVTERLIAQIADRCREAGVDFSLVILMLAEPARQSRLAFARAHGIDVIDCNVTTSLSDLVPGEGHPNGSVHRRWGDCIATALATRWPPGDAEGIAP
jgi:hypothetical protein